jgi:hypothetical protein
MEPGMTADAISSSPGLGSLVGIACNGDPIAAIAGRVQTEATMREDPADLDPPKRPLEEPRPDEQPSMRPTVDEMSEWSFPASDPPATWTWEVERG